MNWILTFLTLATRLWPGLVNSTSWCSGDSGAWSCSLQAMHAPLRCTEILKPCLSRSPKVRYFRRVIWRRDLHISPPSADALDIIPSEPVLNPNGATKGLLKDLNNTYILMMCKMPVSKSLAPHSPSSLFPFPPLKISTLGKVHWLE